MLTYAITMTFVCGIVFGVLITLCAAEIIRRHENKQAITNSTLPKEFEMPFNVLDYSNMPKS